jgi:hypothetical protein
MNPLQSRKQLLIAESELNRALMVGDVTALKADIRTFTGRAKSLSSIASAAALLLAGLMSIRRGKPADPPTKQSWLQKILKAAGLISTIWLACRSPGRDRDGI